jgi:hypothetical protein
MPSSWASLDLEADSRHAKGSYGAQGLLSSLAVRAFHFTNKMYGASAKIVPIWPFELFPFIFKYLHVMALCGAQGTVHRNTVFLRNRISSIGRTLHSCGMRMGLGCVKGFSLLELESSMSVVRGPLSVVKKRSMNSGIVFPDSVRYHLSVTIQVFRFKAENWRISDMSLRLKLCAFAH